MTRQCLAVNVGQGGTEWHHHTDLHLGPPTSPELSIQTHATGDDHARR